MTIRDRMWIDLDHLRVFGPFVGVDVPRLRAALNLLHGSWPTSPVFRWLDRDRCLWNPVPESQLPAFLDQMVVHAGPGASGEALATQLLDQPLTDQPLRLAVGGGFLGVRLSHSAGDGRVLNTLVPTLVHAAATGRPPLAPSSRAPRAPLISAGVRQLGRLGRSPERIPNPLRSRRPPLMELSDSDAGRIWRPLVAYHSARSTSALLRMRAWREANGSHVSVASMLAAAAWNAFAAEGIGSRRPGLTILIDLRRFLSPGRPVWGNFSWGQYVVPSDPTDARSVHQCVRAELDGGTALLMMALRGARIVLAGGRPAPQATVSVIPTRASVELTLTHLGRLDSYLDLPWSGSPGTWRNISVPPPSGPLGITMSTSELSGTLHVSVGFHASTFDRQTVAASVDRLCSDPVGLLEGCP